VGLITYYTGSKIKRNGMGRACGTCGREERCVRGLGEEIHLENLEGDGRILSGSERKWWESAE
jgi:hypothetical protein